MALSKKIYFDPVTRYKENQKRIQSLKFTSPDPEELINELMDRGYDIIASQEAVLRNFLN